MPARSIAANVALFVAVTAAASLLLGAAQPALGVPDVVIQIVQFSPALGAAAVWLLRWRSPDLRRSARFSLRLSRAAALRLAGVTALFAAVFAAALGLYTGVFGGALEPGRAGGSGFPIALILAAQLIGACGEEAGWRCYLQTELQQRWGPVATGIAVGLLWGAWHIHVFAQEPWAITGFFLMTVSVSVILSVLLLHDSTGNLLIAGVLHALINLGLLFFLPDAIEHGTQIMSLALPFAAAATAVALIPSLHGTPREPAPTRA
ncbi:CPBP family intramembrane glutamic endopeptidase [Nocardiopsis coralliicola]